MAAAFAFESFDLAHPSAFLGREGWDHSLNSVRSPSYDGTPKSGDVLLSRAVAEYESPARECRVAMSVGTGSASADDTGSSLYRLHHFVDSDLS